MRSPCVKLFVGALAAILTTVSALPAGAAVTDDEVQKAIEKGRGYLISLARPDGSFGTGDGGPGGISALVFMTLAYMREHPNRDYMSRGLDFLMNVNPETAMGGRQGYAVPIRIMGLAYLQSQVLLVGDKRQTMRLKMMEDIQRLILGQATNGGWRYLLRGGTDYDFSVSQWPILAFREANLVGIEFPEEPLRKARELYFKMQQDDGGWYYQDKKEPASGSMTAAGTASLFIIADVLEPMSGCPCSGGRSQSKTGEIERRIDSALAWLSKHFATDTNPKAENVGKGRTLYWLYCVERVGIAAGYKYFGNHNWYREGAEAVIKKQAPNGSWGDVPDTCFALLFLYKGRAPILFNKLKFDGTWNAHRRDIANLTNYIERKEEQQFHWQIVELKEPMEELHDAPILYITAEEIKEKSFSDAEKKKLRQFTDTGGTILFEASCGNPAVRKWFTDSAKEIWPEWPLKGLGPDHGSFTVPYSLRQRPEILGIDDGMRTCVFYAMDDVSCSWQTKAVTSKGYLFDWGFNLYTYATDGAPLRAKLAGREPEKATRYKDPVKAGPRTTIKVARVKHGGNWEVGANYGGLKKVVERVKAAAGITLDVKEPTQTPFTSGGVSPADLGDAQVAYITASTALAFKPEEKQALKAYADKGGFLWLESARGESAFDQSVRQLATDMKWELKLLPNTHGLMTGRMDPGTGYNLTTGVTFRKVLRLARLSRPCAEFWGLYQGDKMIGVYSPLDIVFSTTGYEAFQCKGYKPPDAAAVATNLAIYFSTLK